MTRWLGVALVGALLIACGDDDGWLSKMLEFQPPDAGSCPEAEHACGDDLDDDCDTRVDCADDDCASDPACAARACVGTPVAEVCWDDWDDDCDGLPDCADPDCARSVQCNTTCACIAGATRWCETPDSTWGRQDCGDDGSWADCTETATRPPGCAGNHYDPECCAGSDGCCQDAPATGSIGACSAAIQCS